MDDKVQLGGLNESSKDYIENLEYAHQSSDGEFVDTNHHIGASYVKRISSTERLVHYQTKIVQTRYNSDRYRDSMRTSIKLRATAMMDVILHFKKDKAWKIAGVAGVIKWIEIHRPQGPKEVVHPSSDQGPKYRKIVENTLRYHRISPVSRSSPSPSEDRATNQALDLDRHSPGPGALVNYRGRSRGRSYQGDCYGSPR